MINVQFITGSLYSIINQKRKIMRHLKLLILLLVASMIFFACEKDQELSPDLQQNNQEINDLKAEPTSFCGISSTLPYSSLVEA